MHDIVKDSEPLKQAILARMDELGVVNAQIIEDARKRGIKGITHRSLSVWRHHSNAKGALNQLNVIYLAYRLGIRVRLTIGEPVLEDGKLRYIIPTPFNETEAIRELELLFPPISVPEPVKKKKK